jgi:NAD(P)-dependent dehydrogenase (short-subunit alcohol dehydrogenase family)
VIRFESRAPAPRADLALLKVVARAHHWSSCGRIINISTVGAHTPPQVVPDYDSAKAAMLALRMCGCPAE